MASRFVVLLFVVLLGTPVPAGESDEERSPADANLPTKPYGIRRVGEDARALAMRPFRLERDGKVKAAVVAGVTLVLYSLRDEIRDEVRERSSAGRSRFLQDARTMGKGAFAPSLALVAYGASFATGNAREKETAFLLLESAAFSAALAYTGSFLLAAERPEDGDSIRFADTDGHGVSLDAALAASVVPVIHRRYLAVRDGDRPARKFWKRAATGLLYSGAALTAYQRLDQDKHWAPDAFLGTMTGLLVGETLCRAHGDGGRRRTSLRPGYSGGGPGLVIVIDLDGNFRKPKRDRSR